MTGDPTTFDRDRRLTTAAEFKRVFDQARRTADPLLLVLARENHLPRARLGLAIGRNRMARACARNRVKRIIRESFRSHQQMLAGLDLVVLARTNLTQADNRALFQSLVEHWQRQHRLRQPADTGKQPPG